MPLVRLLQDWASFTHDSILPEGTARLRWVAPYLFRARHRIREVRRRTKRRDVVPDEEPITVIGTAPTADLALSARQLLPFLRRPTSAQRSRAWLAHEVHGVPVREIARKQRRSTTYPVRQARFQGRSAAGRAFRAVSDGAATAQQLGWAGDL